MSLQVLEIIKKTKLNYLRLTQHNSIPSIDFKNIILLNNPSKDNLNKTICKIVFNDHNKDLNDTIKNMYSDLKQIISSYYKNIYTTDFDEDVVQHDLTWFKNKKISSTHKIDYVFIRLQETFSEDYDSLDLNYTYNMSLKLKGIYIKPDKILLDWKLSEPIKKDGLIKDVYNYVEANEDNDEEDSNSDDTSTHSDTDNDEEEKNEDKTTNLEEHKESSTTEGSGSDKTNDDEEVHEEVKEEVKEEVVVKEDTKEVKEEDTVKEEVAVKEEVKEEVVVKENAVKEEDSDNDNLLLSDSDNDSNVIIIDNDPKQNRVNKIRKLKEKEIEFLQEKIILEKSELELKTQQLDKYLAKLKILTRKIKTTNNEEDLKKINKIIDKISQY